MSNGVTDFKAWLIDRLRHLTNEQGCLLLMMLCSIWKSGNQVVWENKSASVRMTVNSAGSMLVQWQQAQARNMVQVDWNAVRLQGALKWVPPQEDWYKLNIDAACFASNRKMGFEGILRNNMGEVVSVYAGSLCGFSTHREAEALVVREALSWIYRRGWRQVELELDCLEVVQAILDQRSYPSYFHGIIDDCKAMMKNLDKIRVGFVFRLANMVAHTLARATFPVVDCME